MTDFPDPNRFGSPIDPNPSSQGVGRGPLGQPPGGTNLVRTRQFASTPTRGQSVGPQPSLRPSPPPLADSGAVSSRRQVQRAPTNVSLLEEAGRSIARQPGRLVEGFGGILSAGGALTASLIPGVSAREGAQPGRELVSFGRELSEPFPPSRTVQELSRTEDALDNFSSARWWLSVLPGEASVLGLQLLSGVGLASKLGRVGRGLSFAAPSVVREGGLAASRSFDRLREDGVNPNTAALISSAEGIATGAGTLALEQFPASRFVIDSVPGAARNYFDNLANSISRIPATRAGFREGVTEMGQEALADTIQFAFEQDVDAFENGLARYLQAAAVGQVLGATAEKTLTQFRETPQTLRKAAFEDELEKVRQDLIGHGISQTSADAFTNRLRNNPSVSGPFLTGVNDPTIRDESFLGALREFKDNQAQQHQKQAETLQEARRNRPGAFFSPGDRVILDQGPFSDNPVAGTIDTVDVSNAEAQVRFDDGVVEGVATNLLSRPAPLPERQQPTNLTAQPEGPNLEPGTPVRTSDGRRGTILSQGEAQQEGFTNFEVELQDGTVLDSVRGEDLRPDVRAIQARSVEDTPDPEITPEQRSALNEQIDREAEELALNMARAEGGEETSQLDRAIELFPEARRQVLSGDLGIDVPLEQAETLMRSRDLAEERILIGEGRLGRTLTQSERQRIRRETFDEISQQRRFEDATQERQDEPTGQPDEQGEAFTGEGDPTTEEERQQPTEGTEEAPQEPLALPEVSSVSQEAVSLLGNELALVRQVADLAIQAEDTRAAGFVEQDLGDQVDDVLSDESAQRLRDLASQERVWEDLNEADQSQESRRPDAEVLPDDVVEQLDRFGVPLDSLVLPSPPLENDLILVGDQLNMDVRYSTDISRPGVRTFRSDGRDVVVLPSRERVPARTKVAELLGHVINSEMDLSTTALPESVTREAEREVEPFLLERYISNRSYQRQVDRNNPGLGRDIRNAARRELEAISPQVPALQQARQELLDERMKPLEGDEQRITLAAKPIDQNALVGGLYQDTLRLFDAQEASQEINTQVRQMRNMVKSRIRQGDLVRQAKEEIRDNGALSIETIQSMVGAKFPDIVAGAKRIISRQGGEQGSDADLTDLVGRGLDTYVRLLTQGQTRDRRSKVFDLNEDDTNPLGKLVPPAGRRGIPRSSVHQAMSRLAQGGPIRINDTEGNILSEEERLVTVGDRHGVAVGASGNDIQIQFADGRTETHQRSEVFHYRPRLSELQTAGAGGGEFGSRPGTEAVGELNGEQAEMIADLRRLRDEIPTLEGDARARAQQEMEDTRAELESQGVVVANHLDLAAQQRQEANDQQSEANQLAQRFRDGELSRQEARQELRRFMENESGKDDLPSRFLDPDDPTQVSEEMFERFLNRCQQ